MDKDKQEDLYALLCMEQVESLVAWMQEEVSSMQTRIVRYDLMAATNSAQGLAYEKCRVEGAEKMLFLLKTKIKTFKERAKERT